MSIPVLPFQVQIGFVVKQTGATPEFEAELRRRLELTRESLEAFAFAEVNRRMAGFASMSLADSPATPPPPTS